MEKSIKNLLFCLLSFTQYFSYILPIDGSIFLLHPGASNRAVSAVLFHTSSREEAKALYPGSSIDQLYDKIGKYKKSLIDVVTEMSDLHIDDKGNIVTVKQRIEGISARYGEDSVIAQFMSSQYEKFTRR